MRDIRIYKPDMIAFVPDYTHATNLPRRATRESIKVTTDT